MSDGTSVVDFLRLLVVALILIGFALLVSSLDMSVIPDWVIYLFMVQGYQR